MNKRMEPAELSPSLESKSGVETVFRNGDLLMTTRSTLTFVSDQGRKQFKSYVVTEDQRSIMTAIRALQSELKQALRTSRHFLRPGEMKFELLARDPDAPWFVRFWAHKRAKRDPRDPKILAALTLADEMEEWKKKNPHVGFPSGAETPETIRQAAEELVLLAKNHGMALSISVSQSEKGTETKIDIGSFSAQSF